MSLFARLVLLVLVAVLPAIGVQGYTAYEWRRDREADLREEALRQATMIAQDLQGGIRGTEQILLSFAESRAVREQDSESCNAFADRLQRRSPQFVNLAATDRDGRVFCSNVAATLGVSVAKRPYFTAARESFDLVVGEFTVAHRDGHRFLPLALPFVDPDGRPAGIVFAELELGQMERTMHDKPLPPGASLTVADRNGTVLMERPAKSRPRTGERLEPPLLARLAAQGKGIETVVATDGASRIDGFIPPALTVGGGLMVIVGLSVDQALAPIVSATRIDALLIVAMLALALGAAWAVAQRFVRRPVAMLVRAAERWRAGDFAARSGLKPTEAGEFGRIGAAFDQMATTLERHERALQDANRFKSRLLAVAAHDLRQPLQVIIGTHDRLLKRARDTVSEIERKRLAQAERAADRLIEQVDLLADAVLLDGEGLEPRREVVGVEPLFEEIRELFGPEAAAKDIDLRVVGCARPRVETDRRMLATILHNLVGNAVKYTPPGGVVLVGGRRRGETLALEVHDTGIGIDEQKLSAIFEAFYRVETTSTQRGLGLGLSIVKRTADMLGHRLDVHSVAGSGSCFAVELPLAVPPRSDGGLKAA